MTLKDQLNADLRDAMRAGDRTRTSTLRLLITAVRNAEIPPEGAAAEEPARRVLDDEGVANVIRREVKQRRDSMDAYTKASRPDLVALEEAEMQVLARYLPAQMTAAEIEAAAR